MVSRSETAKYGVVIVCAAVTVFGLACNALLGNAEHEEAADAAADGARDARTMDATTDMGPMDVTKMRDALSKEGGAHIDAKEDVPIIIIGEGGLDASDGGDSGPPSCAPGGAGMTNCGPDGGESCCSSLEVASGTFYRSYDAVINVDAGHPASISGFRLDRFETTVGRFRQFVTAVSSGWVPAAGSGKHVHLNSGSGLEATSGSGYEPGWDSSWTSSLATSESAWNTNLTTCASGATWSALVGANENKPINCVTWYEVYAFCIWDGGFLPSEAEWNYAAAAGGGSSGQRVYPWSVPSTSTTTDCTYANYSGTDSGKACVAKPSVVGSYSPTGDGFFGQADLAGNIYEWTLDYYKGAYTTPCSDCADVTPNTSRVVRGGAFDYKATTIETADRRYSAPTTRIDAYGARCARVP